MQGYFYISVAFSNFLQVDLVHLLVHLFLGTSSVNTFVNEIHYVFWLYVRNIQISVFWGSFLEFSSV